MKLRKRWIGIGIAACVVLGGGAIAVASGVADDDATERPITGSDLERASQAALDHTGGGTVTDTEVEDEESYYEVEVAREDGSQVDVQLNEAFEVVGIEDETDSEDDEDD